MQVGQPSGVVGPSTCGGTGQVGRQSNPPCSPRARGCAYSQHMACGYPLAARQSCARTRFVPVSELRSYLSPSSSVHTQLEPCTAAKRAARLSPRFFPAAEVTTREPPVRAEGVGMRRVSMCPVRGFCGRGRRVPGGRAAGRAGQRRSHKRRPASIARFFAVGGTGGPACRRKRARRCSAAAALPPRAAACARRAFASPRARRAGARGVAARPDTSNGKGSITFLRVPSSRPAGLRSRAGFPRSSTAAASNVYTARRRWRRAQSIATAVVGATISNTSRRAPCARRARYAGKQTVHGTPPPRPRPAVDDPMGRRGWGPKVLASSPT